MHIVHLMASPVLGGPERQVLGLARALRDDCRTTFVSFAERGLARPLLDCAAADGFGSVELKANFPRAIASIREIASLLRSLQADVVCTSGYKPDLAGWRAARSVGVPVVGIAHGWTGATWKVRFNEWLDAMAMRFMDAVVCVSEAMAVKAAKAGVPGRKLVVIRNALDASAYDEPCPTARANVEALFGDDKPRLIVGAVGRLSPEKGFDVLIRAASLVKSPDVGFVLFGDGPLRAELERQAAPLGGRFRFAGFRNDLERFLPGLDLAASSSHTEGLPVAVLEAQAAGLPVVATAVGGTPEVIVAGDNGLLVPPGSPESLASALDALLADEPRRREMGRRAWQRVRDEFTFAAQAAQYRKLFAGLLPRRVARVTA
jgi:glycosyltransferase involved in cell wall biosynthesis